MTVLLIAHNTLREVTRDRVVFGLVAAGLLLLLVTQLLSPLALGEGRRLTVDLGLSGISMLGLLVILTVGTSLVAKEIERRTIYNLLSRPVPRAGYILGKWVGLSSALWLVAIALGLALLVLVAVLGLPRFAPAIAQAIYLAGLELTVVTAIAVLFSALSTPVLSALYTVGLYCVGQWCHDLRAFAEQFPGAVGGSMRLAADLAPNLPLFNMRSLAADGATTSWLHLGLATAYAVVYCGCALALATAAFESRDFK